MKRGFSWLWIRVHFNYRLSYLLLRLCALLGEVLLFEHRCDLFIWALQEFVNLCLSLVFNWIVSLWLIARVSGRIWTNMLVADLHSWLACCRTRTWSSNFFLLSLSAVLHIVALNIFHFNYFFLTFLVWMCLKVHPMLLWPTLVVQRLGSLFYRLTFLENWLLDLMRISSSLISRISLLSTLGLLSLYLWFSLWRYKLIFSLNWLRIVLSSWVVLINRRPIFLQLKLRRHKRFGTLLSLVFRSFWLVHGKGLACLLSELVLAQSACLILVFIVCFLLLKYFCIIFYY